MNGVCKTNIDCSFVIEMVDNYCILGKIQLWPTTHQGCQLSRIERESHTWISHALTPSL